MKKKLPPEFERTVVAHVPCMFCGAGHHWPCVTPDWKFTPHIHATRIFSFENWLRSPDRMQDYNDWRRANGLG